MVSHQPWIVGCPGTSLKKEKKSDPFAESSSGSLRSLTETEDRPEIRKSDAESPTHTRGLVGGREDPGGAGVRDKGAAEHTRSIPDEDREREWAREIHALTKNLTADRTNRKLGKKFRKEWKKY
ncbi:hypothetical protein TruAng_011947 [Truncatella angustata]|nr:hypothetical protein TruAng_011947 [Truncatella angustata]